MSNIAKTVRLQDDVDALLDQCVESEETGSSKYPGMTYEQGIRNAIDWLQNQDFDHPMDDE